MSYRWWILTIPVDKWDAELPDGVKYIKGQQEIGEGGYHHWQVVCYLERKSRMSAVKKLFCNEAHCEHTRSEAALGYVWKEETAVEFTQFEYGEAPKKRNDKQDWETMFELAKRGMIDEIPADVRIRCYSTLRKIEKDYMKPEGGLRKVIVYVGPTGVGKSSRAWHEAGLDAYPKDPNTKFWDGYCGQENIVIDEFRGRIDISHILRWFDRYPVCVENKGGGTVLRSKKIWITTNLPVVKWYPDIDDTTFGALLRRLEIITFSEWKCEEVGCAVCAATK